MAAGSGAAYRTSGSLRLAVQVVQFQIVVVHVKVCAATTCHVSIWGPGFLLHARNGTRVLDTRGSDYAGKTTTVTVETNDRFAHSSVKVAYDLFEASAKAVVHPNIYKRICYRMTHSQVVSDKPDIHNVLVLPDVRFQVSYHYESVERKPGESERDDTEYYHFDHLVCVCIHIVVGDFGCLRVPKVDGPVQVLMLLVNRIQLDIGSQLKAIIMHW